MINDQVPIIKQTRISQIDAIKGFAIFLVVLGHSIQANALNFDDNSVFRIIYSFHMPLFMFLSGYVTHININYPISGFIAKRFRTLVVPFISWHLILFIFLGRYQQQLITHYLYTLFNCPDMGLWFLWILFLNSCIFALTVTAARRHGKIGLDSLVIASILLVLLAGHIIHTNAFGFNLLVWHYPFFILGFLLGRKTVLNRIGFFIPFLITSFIFYFLGYWWQRVSPPTFSDNLIHWGMLYHLHYFTSALLYIYKYAVPTFGIIASCGFFFILAKIKNLELNRVYSGFVWLGTYSLDIYVIHQVFVFQLGFGVGVGIIRIISSTLIAIIISLTLSIFIIRPNKLLNICLLGSRHKAS